MVQRLDDALGNTGTVDLGTPPPALFAHALISALRQDRREAQQDRRSRYRQARRAASGASSGLESGKGATEVADPVVELQAPSASSGLASEKKVPDAAKSTTFFMFSELDGETRSEPLEEKADDPVSYTHLTLPTIYSV